MAGGFVSITDGPVPGKPHGVSGNGMLRVKEEDKMHILLKHQFYMSIGFLAQHCTVVAAYRNMHSSPMGKARLEALRVFLKTMTEKHAGNANLRNCWCGTTEDGVHQILNDGFVVGGMPEGGWLLGCGLYLYSECSAIDSVLASPVDEDGLGHLLFCRVILGSMEEVPPRSRQFCPSSENFDSGVDNQQYPTKYIVWFPHVNTHVLPLYYLGVKLDFRRRGLQREPFVRPTSPWIPLSALVSMLSKSLPPSTMCLIKKVHSDFMERKITRQQLILRMRQLAGDKLLISAIKAFREKKVRVKNVSSKEG